VQILTPPQLEPIGIGMFVRPRTDFIGPIELGSYWEAHLLPATGERDLATARLYSQSPTPELVLGEFQNSPTEFSYLAQPQESTTAHGDSARLQVTLSSPIGVLLDTTTIQVTHDAQTGIQWAIGQQASGTVTGGFNTQDRSNLELTLGAVRAVLPPALTGGPSVAFGLVDLVRGPPRSMLRRFGSVLISGRGALSAIPPGALHSFGGTWSLQTLPSGYGRDDGVVPEYHRRLGQFVVLRDEVTSDLYIDVLEDSHWSDNFILWQFPNPIEIQYDIAPGVVLVWQWLI